MCYKCTGNHRDIHRGVHSFPTRRSSDLEASTADAIYTEKKEDVTIDNIEDKNATKLRDVQNIIKS